MSYRHSRPAGPWEEPPAGSGISTYALCLQRRHKPWHELVDPEHFLAALDHHDVALPEQRGDFPRLKRRRIFVPAEPLACRQQVVQMAHQRSYAVYAINPGEMLGQRLV